MLLRILVNHQRRDIESSTTACTHKTETAARVEYTALHAWEARAQVASDRMQRLEHLQASLDVNAMRD